MKLYLSDQPIIDPAGVLPVFSPIDSTLRAGTLAILDPAHSTSPLGAMPANGGTIPNIVPAAQLNALLGQSLTQADYAWLATASGVSPATALLELTPKKALNVTTTQQAQNAAMQISWNAALAIRNYILANLTHTFLFVMEANTTRAAQIVSGQANAQIPNFQAQNVSGSFNNFLAMGTAQGFFPADSKLIGSKVAGSDHNALGEKLLAVAAQGFTGTVPTAANFNVGPSFAGMPGYNGATYYNKARSGALRRFVIEDLTVSGISFDRAVNGIGARDSHVEQWQRDLSATYGRWAGDTLRDPATLP